MNNKIRITKEQAERVANETWFKQYHWDCPQCRTKHDKRSPTLTLDRYTANTEQPLRKCTVCDWKNYEVTANKPETVKWVTDKIKAKYPDTTIKYRGDGCHECGAETNTLRFMVYGITDADYEAFNDFTWELHKQSRYELMIDGTSQKRGAE